MHSTWSLWEPNTSRPAPFVILPVPWGWENTEAWIIDTGHLCFTHSYICSVQGTQGKASNNSLLKTGIYPSRGLREDGLVSAAGMTLSGHSKVLRNFWNHGKRLQHPAQSLCVEHSPEAGNTCCSEKNRDGVTFHLSKTALRCTIGCLMPWNNSRLRAWEARSLFILPC